MDIDILIKRIVDSPEVEGISISGGEPYLQPIGLAYLCTSIKKISDLSILVYTGNTLDELLLNNDCRLSLNWIDVLIAGPYIAAQKLCRPLLSSANQKIHFLTNRYSMLDLDCADCEFIIQEDGTIFITGSHI